MKRVLIIGLILIANAVVSFAQENVKTSRVTYLANSSFLVKVGETNIMFDGVFTNGMDRYWAPTDQTVNQIRNAEGPFADIDLVLISNKYADHFDPRMAVEFMSNNQKAKMICPQQVVNKMKIFVNDFKKIKDRIIETTPLTNYYDRMLVGNIEVLAFNVELEDYSQKHIENMAYMVNVNGVKILHSGDSSPKMLDKMHGVNLATMNIDIALLTDLYAVGRAAKLTNEIVDADYYVLMHFNKHISNKQLASFADKCKLNVHPVIFMARNEGFEFYMDDYYQAPTTKSNLAYNAE